MLTIMNKQDTFLPHDIKLFKSCSQQWDRKQKFFYVHVRSLQSKEDELSLLFESMNLFFDVIMITETCHYSDSDHFMLPGYSHIWWPHGGGVLMLTRSGDIEKI